MQENDEDWNTDEREYEDEYGEDENEATNILRTTKRKPGVDGTGANVGGMEITTRMSAVMRTRTGAKARKMTKTRTRTICICPR